MTQRRIRIKDDKIEVNVEGRIYRPAAMAINGGQILVRPDRQGLVIETDSFIHMDMDPAANGWVRFYRDEDVKRESEE